MGDGITGFQQPAPPNSNNGGEEQRSNNGSGGAAGSTDTDHKAIVGITQWMAIVLIVTVLSGTFIMSYTLYIQSTSTTSLLQRHFYNVFYSSIFYSDSNPGKYKSSNNRCNERCLTICYRLSRICRWISHSIVWKKPSNY
jgi:hypothetical protein